MDKYAVEVYGSKEAFDELRIIKEPLSPLK